MYFVRSFVALATVVALASITHPARADDLKNWQGGYAGLEVGADIAETHRNFIPEHTTTGSFGATGVIGGATLGYNWQASQAVFGLEADFSGGSTSGTHACPGPTFACDVYSNWLGTVRPRLGYAFGPLMPYATGGLAFGDVHSHSHNYATGTTGSEFDDSEVGWTAGGGLEYALPASPFSIKAEYLYVNLNDANGPGGGGEATVVKFHQNIARLGLNYGFN